MQDTIPMVPTYIIIVNTMMTNFIIAGVFLWLWFLDRKVRSFPLWAAVYVATGFMLALRLGSGGQEQLSMQTEAFFVAIRVVLTWMGTCEFTGNRLKSPWITGLTVLGIYWSIGALAAGGVFPMVLPFIMGSGMLLLSGAILLRQSRREPGVGFGAVGWLLVVFSGSGLLASFWLTSPQDPKAHLIAPIFNMVLGLLIMVNIGRKQQRALGLVNQELLHEAEARRLAQEESRQAGQRYRAILDSTRSLIGLLAPDGTVLDANQTSLAQVQVPSSEIVGKRFWETAWWIHDERQQQRLREAIRRVAAGGNDNFVAHAKLPDGSTGHFNFFLTPIRDASGKVVYLVPEGHDITERKQMEHTLHVAEQRFRAISEGSMLGVFASGRVGELVYVSRRACEITGVSEVDAYAGRWVDAVHPADRLQLETEIGLAMKERRPFSSERRYVRSGGTVVWTRTHVAPIIEENELVGFVGTIEDITANKAAEQALRDSQEKFASFFSMTPEPIAVMRHPDGNYVEVNEAWLRTFGFRPTEVKGRNNLDLGLWREPGEHSRLFGELLQQGELASTEVHLRRKNGDDVTALVSARVIELDQSKVILWNMHDITAQRRMEQTLREREAQFSQLFKLGPEPLALMRTVDHHYVDVSEAWLKKFGYTREEVIGRTPQELDLLADTSLGATLFNTLMERDEISRAEEWFKAKDGTRILAEISARRFDLNDVGYILWHAHDITERRQIEQALRESEEKFSAVFHLSPVALGVTSIRGGVFVDVNEAWIVQFGHYRERILGRTSVEIGLWKDVEERSRLLDDAKRGECLPKREVWLKRADGTEILCEASGQVVELNGQSVVVWSAHDVTEQRRVQHEISELNVQLEARVHERTARLEQANLELAGALDALKLAQEELVRAEKLSALGSLVAGVAHELNTPIGNSITVASTLFDKTQDFSVEVASGHVRQSSLDDYIESARTATELLQHSLAQANELVSSFKQVAVDQASAQRRRFDLRLVVEEVAVTLAPMLKKTSFKFDLNLADDLIMDSYPGPLGQVITNLVTNSLAHGFEGREQGRMVLSARRSGKAEVEVDFIDDGIGIRETDLKRIFDPFFTTKLGRGGSGLGLHIVYNIVTRILGGKIKVDSENSGAHFTLTLPLVAPEAGVLESFA